MIKLEDTNLYDKCLIGLDGVGGYVVGLHRVRRCASVNGVIVAMPHAKGHNVLVAFENALSIAHDGATGGTILGMVQNLGYSDRDYTIADNALCQGVYKKYVWFGAIYVVDVIGNVFVGKHTIPRSCTPYIFASDIVPGDTVVCRDLSQVIVADIEEEEVGNEGMIRLCGSVYSPLATTVACYNSLVVKPTDTVFLISRDNNG